MPCIDLGLEVVEDFFCTADNTFGPYTVDAPMGKKFVSASYELCTVSGGVDTCGALGGAQAIIPNSPNSDLDEWSFWFIRTGSGGATVKVKIKLVAIDA